MSRQRGAGRGAKPAIKKNKPKGRGVIGIHACREALKVRPHSVIEVWLRKDFEDNQELAAIHQKVQKLGTRIKIRSTEALEQLGSGHQGLAIWLNEDPSWPELLERDSSVLAALDEIEDPHNLGAILRSGWLFGLDGILVPERRSSPLTPVACKVSTGACEHVPVQKVANLNHRLKELKDQNYWVFGLDAAASESFWDVKLPEKLVWVIGSEGRGLRSSTAKACDQMLKIPQLVADASFNASVAAALAFSESFRQLRNH